MLSQQQLLPSCSSLCGLISRRVLPCFVTWHCSNARVLLANPGDHGLEGQESKLRASTTVCVHFE